MRRTSWVGLVGGVILIVVGLSAQGPATRGGTRVKRGEPCPPGTTETRPGSCQAPEFPPPSIVDYRPRSTLVTPQHLVPKAKFPVVDIHGHASLSSPESVATIIQAMDALNLRVFVSADNSSGERLARALATISASPHKDRFRVLAGVDFRNVGPGWAEQAVKQLEADIAAGAVGVGEVSKSFGLNTRKRDGSRLKVDDPELDPLWQAFARLDVPVFIHTAEPQEFFQPLDNHNERWLELALFANRRNNQPGQVTFDELMTERNNVFKKHPKTRFIAAHFGWHANDLQKAAAMLDATMAAWETCPLEPEPLKAAMEAAALTAGYVNAEGGPQLSKAQAPVRVALTGRSVGPPLFESVVVLGRERTLARLRTARARLG